MLILLNHHFNVRAIRYETCGASFDALMQRTCPYCGHEADLRRHGWVITGIQQPKRAPAPMHQLGPGQTQV